MNLTIFTNYELLPTDQTVSTEYYLSIKLFSQNYIRAELWKDSTWILHHNNAPSHTVLRVFFAKNFTHVTPQPPYSPDLAPCDFWLFVKLKRSLWGNLSASIEDIERESLNALKAIPEDNFLECLKDWKKRWRKEIAGDHFVGTKSIWKNE